MPQTNQLPITFLKFLRSKFIFRLILVVFTVQALWLVFTSNYPMAFDEDFHLGIIRLYASHISPFWAHQPLGADKYGAVARDPSYLYQYLMSFPYRLITLFTNKQSEVVIFLRLINVALFGSGLYLFKKLLAKTGAELHKINFSLLIFVLIPVVPFLAAQINYDNLLFPVTALALIMTTNLADKFLAKKVDMEAVAKLTIVVLLACLVKYAFLPIAFIILLYIIYIVRQNVNKKLISLAKADWRKLTKLKKAALGLAVIVSIVLFSQRYIINLVDYHSPIPDCSKVLTISQCSQYGPWIRNYDYKINRVDTDIGSEKNLITFIADWFDGMWLRTYFTLAGPSQDYQTRGPLPLPSISAIVFALSGLIAVILTYKKILKKYNAKHILFLMLAAAFYTLALGIDEYRAFVDTGQPVAINGRYVFPILLPVILVLVMGLTTLLKGHNKLKTSLGMLAILCAFWGGGVGTYIIRSEPSWYWDSTLIRNVNHTAQKILDPIVPGSARPIEYL